MPGWGGHLFAYGSLVNLRSLARAFDKHEVHSARVRPARLQGWRRTWGAAEAVIPDGQPDVVWARFLDLARDPSAQVNGLLVVMDGRDRLFVERREQGYQMVDVTVDGEQAITFAGRREPGPAGTVVLAEYVKLVEEGFAALGAEQLEEFRRTTAPIDAPILPGPYRFADAKQNALTTWGKKA